jgi:hypothetical protein
MKREAYRGKYFGIIVGQLPELLGKAITLSKDIPFTTPV